MYQIFVVSLHKLKWNLNPINETKMDDTDNKGQWHWQEPGTAWNGMGIYHVTLVVPSRKPLLGTLVIPEDDPEQAYVERTNLGKDVVHALAQAPVLYPEVQLLQYCLMPDHLHAVLYVTQPMSVSIRKVVRGVWQGAKTAARQSVSSIVPELHSGIFTERPFIRPMSRKGQLQSMLRYVQANPQRLATKRLKPGYFYVQEHIEIAGRTYSAIGNAKLLQAARIEPVHVRSAWEQDTIRDYKNSCIQAARDGSVMVSPFISEHEKAVLTVLLQERHPIIYIADNGFGKYYKPSATLFDAVADGRMLILSPWPYDPEKKGVTRADCVAMNQMAQSISTMG